MWTPFRVIACHSIIQMNSEKSLLPAQLETAKIGNRTVEALKTIIFFLSLRFLGFHDVSGEIACLLYGWLCCRLEQLKKSFWVSLAAFKRAIVSLRAWNRLEKTALWHEILSEEECRVECVNFFSSIHRAIIAFHKCFKRWTLLILSSPSLIKLFFRVAKQVHVNWDLPSACFVS